MKKQEKIKVLQDVIQIKSVNGNEEEVALYLKKLFAQHGIESNLVPYSTGRSNLVATLNKGTGKVLGLTGHMDVVDPGDESAWTYPPFAAHIEDNKLYGRGSTDMKSGLVAMAITMIELKEAETPFKGTIKLLATIGEEIGEIGSEQLTTEHYADDLDGLIIGEPSGYNLVYTHMGSINYSVVSHGKEAHSSMPNEGYNAINHLNRFITEINKQMENIALTYDNKVLGKTIHNVTVISGGNQVNSIPGEAKLQGNIRSIPEFGNEKIISILEQVITHLNENESYKLELKIDYNKIPVHTSTESSLIQVIQSQFKNKLPLIGLSGTTDAAEFTKSAKPFDFVVFGPGITKLAHQVDEYVEIDSYLDMIEKYQSIAINYLN
ncbi:ArgE/DapE family deacylase [Carnobacterium sp.]|uniref:ArgE/DapE family deacylase n=1 Tax=Carnobacterium TaxID=2747 RepID=UPI002FC75521